MGTYAGSSPPERGDTVRKWWLWVLVLALVIIVLGLIFGGYRKGTKLGAPVPASYGLVRYVV